jgi:hypothetical protein
MSALLYLVAPASALLSGLNICDAVKVVLKKKAGIERVPVSPEERQGGTAALWRALVFQNPVARAALIPRIAAVSLQCSDKIAVSGCKDFCLALNTSHAALAAGGTARRRITRPQSRPTRNEAGPERVWESPLSRVVEFAAVAFARSSLETGRSNRVQLPTPLAWGRRLRPGWVPLRTLKRSAAARRARMAPCGIARVSRCHELN